MLAGSSEEKIQEIKIALRRKFDIKIGHQFILRNLLKNYGMQNCKSVTVPLWMPTRNSKWQLPRIDQQQYQSAIGSLMYLSVSTSPDISFPVGIQQAHTGKLLNMYCGILKEL